MKTAIQLVLIYFGILQVLSPLLVVVPCAIYLFATTGTVDKQALMQMIIIPAQMTGILLMAFYLWKDGYISKEKVTWSPVSPGYLILSIVSLLSFSWLVSTLISHMKWLPDIMEQTFDIMQSGWIGIFAIAVAGPVLEELLFRGAITKALLKQYDPVKAILISAFIFGIFHINPIQVVAAFFIGLLLAWVYYKTASLIPCILMHILNNSISVYLNIKYPGVDDMDALVGGTANLIITCVAAVLLVGCYEWMKRITIAYPWKRDNNVEILTEKDR